MSLFDVTAILLTVAALGGYINDQWIRLPLTISLMLFAMAVGLLGIGLQHLGWVEIDAVRHFLHRINFSETVFHGMLSFLLFAGALQLNLQELKKAKLPVAITATASTVISTFLVGAAFYALADILFPGTVNWLYALLFGSILAPTDPIAVLAIIKKLGAPKQLETTIAGESLFNDGVAIVIFSMILGLISAGGEHSWQTSAMILLQRAGGGILAGIAIGGLAYRMLVRTSTHHAELLITLAIASGGYLLAEKLNVSAIIAMVVAGLIIGNYGRAYAMSPGSWKHISSFWEMMEEILNTILFLLIGLQMIVMPLSGEVAVLAALCIPAALLARYISVSIPIRLIKTFYSFKKGTALVMTWGGLRGALSIAMVLTLRNPVILDIFLPCIYFVVVFSIAVQGLTFSRLLKKYDMIDPP